MDKRFIFKNQHWVLPICDSFPLIVSQIWTRKYSLIFSPLCLWGFYDNLPTSFSVILKLKHNIKTPLPGSWAYMTGNFFLRVLWQHLSVSKTKTGNQQSLVTPVPGTNCYKKFKDKLFWKNSHWTLTFCNFRSFCRAITAHICFHNAKVTNLSGSNKHSIVQTELVYKYWLLWGAQLKL